MTLQYQIVLNWRCVIIALFFFWIVLFGYVFYVDIGVEIDPIMYSSTKSNPLQNSHTSDSLEMEQNAHIEIPDMLHISPALITNVSEFQSICPMRRNICIKNREWFTANKSDIFDARPSIRYCRGIVCNSFHAEYDEHVLNNCKMHDISMVMLGQYYPHMFPHVWSRTMNGLWEYSIRLQVISRNHHLVFEQLDYEPLYMLHQLLIQPFSQHPIQHYKNILLDPMFALEQMSVDNNNYMVNDNSRNDDNCACVKEAYYCGFSTDFTKNYPQGFVPKKHAKDGYHFTWDKVEWFKQYWITEYNDIRNNNEMTKSQFIEQYFGVINKPILGLIDKRKNGKWLNIENVQEICTSQSTIYQCKVIRMYEIEKPIELLWIMSKIDILMGYHSNSIVQSGLWLPYTSTIIEILPANPLPSWLDLPGSILQWIFRKIPQRHAWFQLFNHENYHKEAFDASKTHFSFTFDDVDKIVKFVMQHPNKFCFDEDHNMPFPSELAERNFTFDIKEFDTDSLLHSSVPDCNKT